MRRITVIPLTAILALSALAWAPMGASAGAPAGVDCAATPPHWPEPAAVRGATFLGRVLSRYRTTQDLPAYRMRVLRAYAGEFDDVVRVVLYCTFDRPFTIGRRVLVSSGHALPSDGGTIRRVRFWSNDAVSWRVRPDDSVQLKGYGPYTQWEEAPRWLTAPDTLKEAVRAVTPG